MMKVFSFILFFSIIKMLSGQSRYGNMLPDNTVQAIGTVSGDLYVGIDNPLLLSDNKTFILKTNNGRIYWQSDTIYIMPARTGKARLQLYEIPQKDTISVGYVFKNVRNIPEPKLLISDFIIEENARISKDFLLRSDSLKVFVSNDIKGANNWFKIYEYELGYNFGGYYISNSESSNIINQKAKNFILKISPDKILILKVAVRSEGQIKKSLPLYKITLY